MNDHRALGLGGKKFNVLIENNEYFQSTYVTFRLDNDGTLEVPIWEDEDERWEIYGVIILKDKAVIMSKDEYNRLSIHYEDDWDDVCMELSEPESESESESDNQS